MDWLVIHKDYNESSNLSQSSKGADAFCFAQSSQRRDSRATGNFDFQRLYSQPVDKTAGVQADQIITLQGFYAQKGYPEKLRRIRSLDVQNNKRFVFLSNNFTLPPLTIAQLYHCRWQIELAGGNDNITAILCEVIQGIVESDLGK